MSAAPLEVLDRYAQLFEPPDLTLDHLRRRRTRSRRRRAVGGGLAAVGSFAGLVAALIAIAPSEPEPPVLGSSPLEVANGFMHAFVDLDGTAADTFLAEGVVARNGPTLMWRTPEEARLALDVWDAEGLVPIVEPCEEVAEPSTPGSASFRCWFDYHRLGSEEFGWGPYSGSSWDLSVRDGEIVEAVVDLVVDDFFSAGGPGPFLDWLYETHTYGELSRVFSSNGFVCCVGETARSVELELLERRVDEYVAEMTSLRDVSSEMMDLWVAGDGARAAELFSADGEWDGIAAVDLAALHEWFRAIGTEYHVGEACALRTGTADVLCPYTVENDITRALGSDPIANAFVVNGVRGAITDVNDRPSQSANVAWQTFREWVVEHHPNDVVQMYATSEEFWPPALTEVSIDLWARHVDEFAAAGDSRLGSRSGAS